MKNYNKGEKVSIKRCYEVHINGYITDVCPGEVGSVHLDCGDTVEVYFGDFIILEVNKEDIEPCISEEAEEVTIDGWVARNKDNSLYLFKAEPWYNSPRGYWDDHLMSIGCFSIPSESFPHITFDNSPIEITLTLKPKKQ